MGKKITGQQPTPPMAQPPSAKKAGTSSRLVAVSNQISEFIRGKSLLGAGHPPEFSRSAPRESNRVSKAATEVLPKQTKRK